MATQTRFKGLEGETLSQLTIKQNDMIQVRHEVGTANDSDKGLPFSVIQSIPIAVCISAASETNKAATIDNFADFELQNGREVIVYMANANTATNPTLTINGVGLAAMESGIWQAGTFIKCKYVSINVSGSQITRWLVDAGAYNTTTQLNGALAGHIIFKTYSVAINQGSFDGRGWVYSGWIPFDSPKTHMIGYRIYPHPVGYNVPCQLVKHWTSDSFTLLSPYEGTVNVVIAFF